MSYHVIRGTSKDSIMSALTSLDTSQHTTPISAMHFDSKQPTTAQKVETTEKLETPNVAAVDKETPKVDLNNYYANVQASDLNADVKAQATQASQNLSNAVAAAVTHGMDPQDTVNIQKAMVAYETTMEAAKTSNFEIAVE